MIKYVIKYDLSEADVDELIAMSEYLRQHFGNHFIFIPSTFEFSKFNLTEMQHVYKEFGNILKEAENANQETTEH